MEGTKIKNIVILILLLLNGFLLFLVGDRWFEDSHSHETARNSAIQVIRAGGVELEEAAVPRAMTLEHMQASRDLALECGLAAELLGSTVSVEARGGEVYRYYNGNGWVQFHSTGEFMAGFELSVFPLAGQETIQHGADVLRRLGFDGQMLENTVTDGDGSITFRQSWKGAPVLGCQATLNYRDGSLVSITSARRLLGEPHHGTGEEALPVASALMRLYNGLKELGDIYTRIDSIAPAYTMSVSLSGPARLTPVWYIRTDTGTYQMDTQTGQLSRLGSGAVTADAQVLVPEE